MNKKKLYTLAMLMAATAGASAQNTPVSQMEKLDRGVVVLQPQSGNGRFISWRFFGTDNNNTTFDVLRDGKKIAAVKNRTNFSDKNGSVNSEYQIVTKQDGVATDTTKAVKPWTSSYYSMPLDRPEGGVTPKNEAYTYSPNDCSVGDVDGDGQYEIFLKWDPSNSHDNSQKGYTGNVIIDCYKIGESGKPLWRIDLGPNIRAGAHYTQFMVYDFDGDGKAEMILKTAAGSKDGTGAYVSEAADDETIKSVDNTKDWRNSDGKVTGGQEWLTVFDGETGKALHTIFYSPNRSPKSDGTPQTGGAPGWTFNWDDRSGKTDKEYGNRGERYLAAVAYLDGQDKNPSAVFCRGYYTYAYLWAVDFDGSKLKTKWLHASVSRTKVKLYDADGNMTEKTYSSNARGNSGSYTMYANGNHNLSVGDVDGDGCDEIIWGSAAVDNNGSLLYSVGFGHGDAIHLSDLVPSRPGLEVFDVHEEGPHYGCDLHDAATGEILFSKNSDKDNGRGMSADIDGSHEGFEFWSSTVADVFNAETKSVISSSKPSQNFRIYWDGDLQDELFDKTITKWNGSKATTLYTPAGNPQTCNSTKATPCLQADILGDWREELILWDGNDAAHLNIYSTNIATDYRVPTLMHDHVYRMGVAWQNTAYNQPPHLGFYLPSFIDPENHPTAIEDVATTGGNGQWAALKACGNGQTALTLNLKKAQSVRVSVYDMAGARVAGHTYNVSGNAPLTVSPTDGLAGGVYIIKAESTEGRFAKKIVK